MLASTVQVDSFGSKAAYGLKVVAFLAGTLATIFALVGAASWLLLLVVYGYETAMEKGGSQECLWYGVYGFAVCGVLRTCELYASVYSRRKTG